MISLHNTVIVCVWWKEALKTSLGSTGRSYDVHGSVNYVLHIIPIHQTDRGCSAPNLFPLASVMFSSCFISTVVGRRS